MKKVLFVGALLFSGISVAGEQVLLMDQSQRKPGDQVKLTDMSYVLYKDRPCALPIVHAKDMRGGTARYGDGLHKLCWGLTLRNDVVIVDDLGESAPAVPMSIYRAAELQGDGLAVITKAN